MISTKDVNQYNQNTIELTDIKLHNTIDKSDISEKSPFLHEVDYVILINSYWIYIYFILYNNRKKNVKVFFHVSIENLVKKKE